MRPRIRTIKPELWADEKIVHLSRDARLLFLGLVTMADDEGRFRARRSTILGHVFSEDDDAPALIDGWIAEIKQSGLIVFYVANGTPYGAFRHWAKHQKIGKPSPSDLPPAPDRKVVRDNRLVQVGDRWKQALAVKECSGSSPGGFQESSGSVLAPPRLRSDPDPVLDVEPQLRITELCYRLAFRIRANDPRSKAEPGSATWLREMRLLVKDRGDDDQALLEVERIIDWCQADPFWRTNILSPAKLRKQFTQLVLKAQPGLQLVSDDRRSQVVASRNRFVQARRTDGEPA